MKRLSLVIAMIGVFFFLSGAMNAWAFGVAVINDPSGSTKVYLSPAKNSLVLTNVKKNEVFLVISSDKDWCKVFTLDNMQGYIPKNLVTVKWNDGLGIGITFSPDGYSNVYSGQSENYKVLAKLQEGQEFIIIGRDNFFRVLTKDQVEGFVNAGQIAEIYP